MDRLESINQNATYAINDNISFEHLDDGYIILDINNGEYYELNDSSSFIWNLITKQCALKLLIETAKKHYNIGDDKITEILNIIDKFEKLKLIKKIKN